MFVFCNNLWFPYSHTQSRLQQFLLHMGLYKQGFNFWLHSTNHYSFSDQQPTYNALTSHSEFSHFYWRLNYWSWNALFNIPPSKSPVTVSCLPVSTELWLFLTHCKLSPLIRCSVSLLLCHSLFLTLVGGALIAGLYVPDTPSDIMSLCVCAHTHTRAYTCTPICKRTSVLSDRHC